MACCRSRVRRGCEAYVDGRGLIEHNANVSRARDALFEHFADNHFMTAYGELTPQLLDLLKTTHMEEHFKWFFLLGSLGSPVHELEA